MAGDWVVPGNFLEIRNTIDDPMSENRIALIKQMEPILLIDAPDLVVEMRGFEERIGYLRTEGHQIAPSKCVFVLMRKCVIANDAPETVRHDHVWFERIDSLDQTFAQRGAQRGVL